MQDLIKRHFWVLGVLVVMTCTVFAAMMTGHIVEAKYLGDADHAPKVTIMAPAVAGPVKVVHVKDGTQFAARNMFCSDCTPSVDVEAKTDSSQIPITTLPLVLLATNVGLSEDDSYATVINTENQKQGAYALGDPIPGATGAVKAIHFKSIDFENNSRLERLMLAGVAPPPVVAQVETPPAGDDKDDLKAAIDSGIKKIDDNNYEIDKALVDKILGNPMVAVKGARVVPAQKNGKPDGFKLYSIRPDSIYGKLGLINGDTLESINGFELTSLDKGLEVYAKLKDATALEVDLTRKGKPMAIKYTIH